MKKVSLPVLCLSALLASCAPSMGSAGPASPIQEGQVWTVDVSGGAAVRTVTVGTQKRRDGSKIITYARPMYGEGTVSVEDTVGYTSAGTYTPPFAIFAQTRMEGGKKTAFTCLVRNPVDTLNTPQLGLYRFASAEDFARSEDRAVSSLTDGIVTYIAEGTTAGDTTCTLTRIR